MFEIENKDFAPMRVRMVHKGERYGLENCLVWTNDDPAVEFWDTRYNHVEGLGQFISRYNMSNFMDVESGLILDYGVRDWRLSAGEVARVQAWIYEQEIGGQS